MSKTTILDQRAIDALRGDQAALNRLLTAVVANDGMSYMAAFELLQAAAVEGVTVRDALSPRVQLDKVEMDVKTLEASQSAAGRVREHALRQLDAVPVDEHGRVRLLDQGGLPPRRVPSGNADGGPALSPASFETVANQPLLSSRLHRARQLTGAYQGDAGARQWHEADTLHAESNIDLLGTLERAAQVQAADRAGQLVAAQLDAAFQQGGSPKQRRKLCASAAAQTLRMLDQEGL